MERAKLIIVVVLVILMIVVILQNTAPVEANILWFTLALPLAALVFIGVLVGFALGAWFSRKWIIGRRKKAAESSEST